MELSNKQKSCCSSISDWFKCTHKNYFVFSGVAGSGKSTLISVIRKYLPATIRILYCSLTGKASYVLRNKLKLSGQSGYDEISTIHSAIYKPVLDENKKLIGWDRRQFLDYNLIIVDEASMISEDIFKDLSSFKIPILFVGDGCQLSPVNDNFDILINPDIELTEIHRTALHNPIVKLSLMAREEGYIPYGIHGSSVAKVHKKHSIITEFINHSGTFQDTVILCGFNKTRIAINKKIRQHFGYSGNFPEEQERVICLKNNREAKNCPIYNGVLGTVLMSAQLKDHLELNIKIDGEEREYFGPSCLDTFSNIEPNFNKKKIKRIDINPNSNAPLTMTEQSLDFFDFGYCLSVHKSQGSEWGRVMVVEQPCRYWSGKDWNRWLYTAVTRSSKQLLIVR